MSDIVRFFDRFTFILLLFIVALGAFLVFSASFSSGNNYLMKHLVKIIISLILFFIMLSFKTETAFRWSFLLYIFLVAVLIIQLFTGKIISGTKSWIKMGFLSIQVSEFIKIPVALLLAQFFSKVSVLGWGSFIKMTTFVLIPFVLIALQPDMGTAFILLSFILISVLLKRIKFSIIIFSLIVLIAGSFVMWNYMLKPYQKDRIISFVNPGKYSKSSGYQIIQSKIAFGSGGLSGKGYLKGSQSQYKFLPTRHTDFIASVLGEEFGYLGVSFLLLLFFIFFYRQFNLNVRSDEEFYFIFLFNGLILFQFLINILMITGLFPVLGIPLPFVSYGGSSMLAFFIGEGLIFKMKLNNFIQHE
ncbi:MAG: FtsW/RodA/SpoVE family cell cycle protein [Acidobacteriota bacterium]